MIAGYRSSHCPAKAERLRVPEIDDDEGHAVSILPDLLWFACRQKCGTPATKACRAAPEQSGTLTSAVRGDERVRERIDRGQLGRQVGAQVVPRG
jgi:hypothetical protein